MSNNRKGVKYSSRKLASIAKKARECGVRPYELIDDHIIQKVESRFEDSTDIEPLVQEFYKRIDKYLHEESVTDSREFLSSSNYQMKYLIPENAFKEEPKPIIIKPPRKVNPPLRNEIKIESEISADNVGHSLLKGYGWSEGSGLGATANGIRDAVNISGQKDKVGLGGKDYSGDGAFADFRNLQSNEYKRKHAKY